MRIEFFVPGIPAPGGSKRGFYVKKLNRVVIAPDCKRTMSWRDSVATFGKLAFEKVRGQLPPDTNLYIDPLRLEIVFRFLRPKGHYGTGRNAGRLKESSPKYHTTKPDTTKLIRSTEDALKGIIWRDDSQVVEQSARKVYVERDPGAQVTITQIQ